MLLKRERKKVIFMVACSDTKISPEALHLMEVSYVACQGSNSRALPHINLNPGCKTKVPGPSQSPFAFRKSVQYSFGGHLFSPGKSPCLTQLPDSLAGQEGTDGGWRAGSRACPCHSQGQALVALHCLLSQRELGGQREDHRPLQEGRLVFTLHGQRLRLL